MPTPSAPPTPKGRSERRKSEPSGEHVKAGAAIARLCGPATSPPKKTARSGPGQRDRIAEIRDNLTARITEAETEGWLGEVEGLKLSLAGAEDKLAQINRRPHQAATDLGMPAATSRP
jgi:hypothetical protein